MSLLIDHAPLPLAVRTQRVQLTRQVEPPTGAWRATARRLTFLAGVLLILLGALIVAGAAAREIGGAR